MLSYIKYILKWVSVCMNIVLASKSPRRKELLGLLDLDFQIITADIDETMNPTLPVSDEVARLSYEKAAAISPQVSDDTIIISADTVVELDGKVMGKPKDKRDAFNMLKSLSGNTHNVLSGVTVMQGDKSISKTVATAVTFRNITDGEINDYIETNEPIDKAGAYGIQGRGSKFVSGIVGDYFNVVGLPICTLSLILKEFGI